MVSKKDVKPTNEKLNWKTPDQCKQGHPQHRKSAKQRTLQAETYGFVYMVFPFRPKKSFHTLILASEINASQAHECDIEFILLVNLFPPSSSISVPYSVLRLSSLVLSLEIFFMLKMCQQHSQHDINPAHVRKSGLNKPKKLITKIWKLNVSTFYFAPHRQSVHSTVTATKQENERKKMQSFSFYAEKLHIDTANRIARRNRIR